MLGPLKTAALLLICTLVRFARADDGVNHCQFATQPDTAILESISLALEQEPHCKKNQAFLFGLGQKFNQTRQYSEAVDRLEAAILLDPNHWEAHLEFAIALEGMGDTTSVDGILRNLLAIEEIPTPLKRQIKAQLEKRQISIGQVTAKRTVIGMIAGYDDNLMGATHVSSFDLTLPAGRIPVRLGDDDRPKGGNFVRLNFEHEGFVPETGSDKTWSYTINANYRFSPDYTPANFGLFQLIVERGASKREGIYTSGGALLMQSAAGASLRHYKLGTGYDLPKTGVSCRLRLGSKFERRAYPSTDALNGYYVGGMSFIACPALGIQAQIRFGRDEPEYDKRPGGSQNQYVMRISKNTTWGQNNLVSEMEYYRQEDQHGYSPLLENNLKRNINKTLYRLEYRTQIADLGPYIGIEYVDQNANLPLFRVSNQVIYAGVRAVW